VERNARNHTELDLAVLALIGVTAFMHAFNRSSLTGHDVLWNEMLGTTPSSTWPYWR
jgi:hypothetical protein